MLVKQVGAVLVFSTLVVRTVSGQGEPSCCEAEVNVGFSGEIIRRGVSFEGIAGPGERCTADRGEIVSVAPAGTRRERMVCVNIVSNLEGNWRNVQGWSYGVALDGAAELRSLTLDGTAAASVANGGYRDPEGCFNRTQIIDPAKNGGQRGFVSAVACSIGPYGPQMPAVGTESVYAAFFAPAAPQGEEDQIATLRFQRGLVGTGQPVDNVITVDGNSAPVCNFPLARVDLVFRQGGPTELRRGDANGDSRVDIADPIWILNELFLGGPASSCADAADANDDGLVNGTDAIRLIDHIFLGSRPPPPAPGTETCGPDPTGDALGCTLTGPACP
jgi:hypothetical protein